MDENVSTNLYVFINNSAINNFDLFGLFCDDECDEGEIEFEDFQYNFHAALTNSENLTPDEIDDLYSALDQIVDLVDLKKTWAIKIESFNCSFNRNTRRTGTSCRRCDTQDNGTLKEKKQSCHLDKTQRKMLSSYVLLYILGSFIYGRC